VADRSGGGAADFEFEAAYDGLADAILATDRGNRVVYANPSAHALLGWAPGTLVGQPLTALMPSRMRAAHEAGFARYLATGRTAIMGRPVRVPALRQDGVEIDVELTLSPLAGADARGVRVVASMRDLRDRVELERQVLAQQRLAAQNGVMALFADADDVAEVAARMLEAIGASLHWPLGTFWIVDGEALRWLAGWHLPGAPLAAFAERSKKASFASGVGLPGRVWAEPEPAWIVDVAGDENFPRRDDAARHGLHGAFAFPVMTRDAVLGVIEFFARERQAVDGELLQTARTIGFQIGQFIERIQASGRADVARRRAEEAEQRARFLAAAGAALAESLDYQRTLRRVAELAVPAIADWCTVAALDARGRLRRVAVVHRDAEKRSLVDAYEAQHPPGDHRAGELVSVLQLGEAVFRPCVTDAELTAAAQTPEHLEILRGLGCTSCIMAPMLARGVPLGVLSFMRADASRPFVEADLEVAKQLADRAAIAVDNAQLFATTERREESRRFLAEASELLGSSLDYETTFRRLAQLVVPRFGDWCSVQVVEDGKLRQVAVAHVDPAKIELARQLQERYPVDPDAATGVPNVVRTGRSELYEDIPDELLVAGTRDAEHLRLARALVLRSAVTVPLGVRDHVLGGLTLVWAESGHHYTPADLPLLEDLGRRAGLAVDNARLYREAQQAIKLRDEFLSIASHELRTPLTSLQLQVSGMQRNLKKGHPEMTPERIATGIERLDRHTDRLGKLVNELLDVSRASAGQLHLELADVDLGDVARDVAARFEDDLAHAGCAIELSLAGGIVGHWDRTRLEQVITNFLSNAIKYGPQKPIAIELDGDADRAILRVHDHGIGIAAADQPRIFERFARAVSPEHYGGLGLGLWIARVIVEAMHGTVEVASEPGQGATFTMTLPRAH
jgi:PAS domain S-box-containing protein